MKRRLDAAIVGSAVTATVAALLKARPSLGVGEVLGGVLSALGGGSQEQRKTKRRKRRSPKKLKAKPASAAAEAILSKRRGARAKRQQADAATPATPPAADPEEEPAPALLFKLVPQSPNTRHSLKGPRARSLNPSKVSRRELRALRVPDPVAEQLRALRPKTRGECAEGERPCPWVSCSHHLYLDVNDRGAIKLNFPTVGPEDLDQLQDTCALDVADRVAAGEELSLEQVGARMNIQIERTRQLSSKGLQDALVKLRRATSGQVSPRGLIGRALAEQAAKRSPSPPDIAPASREACDDEEPEPAPMLQAAVG